MKIEGQLESATLEQLSADPSTSTQGRIYSNTTSGQAKLDDGVNKRALLRNDQKMIIGNDGTAANNIRIHKGPAGVIQDVVGNDVTAEGTSSTALAQRSSRDENQTDATLPVVGNIGRHVYVTDQKVLAEDDGSAWRKHIAEYSADDSTAGSTITLVPVTSSVVRLTGVFSTLNMIPAGFSSQRVTLINRSGSDASVSHDNGANPTDRIYTGTGANLVFKNNSSLPLYYDSTTQRWQVVGEAAGAAAGGGGVPDSALITVTSNYTALITDDVILADTSNGPITITVPSAAGNLGKRFLFEKIGTRAMVPLTIAATINGIVNDEVWPLLTPFEIISDGANWKTISPLSGETFIESPDPNTFIAVAAFSTANIVLETMSAASSTNIDNVLAKATHRIVLKNQTVTEENGVYLMPSANITISATAYTGVNVNLATLANFSSIQIGPVTATTVFTGNKVSLRFQTLPQENGIYVVGATAGTTVRDTSLRDPSYVTPASLKDFVAFSDWYNYPAANVPSSPTESVASHANDRKLWKQTSISLTTFTGATFTNASDVYVIKVPSNAKVANFAVTHFGGSGSGGATTRGGAGGAGGTPGYFARKLTPGSTVTITVPRGAAPGSGANNGTGGVSFLTIATSSPTWSQVFLGAPSGDSAGTGGAGSGTSPGYSWSSGGNFSTVGNGGYVVFGGANGVGGVFGGGGGGQSAIQNTNNGGKGGTGTASPGSLGAAGFAPDSNTYGGGGGGGGGAPMTGSGRPGRGGFGGAGAVKITWG